jgi:glycerol-3-phosphate dehydrogenase (NAD(P)+)
MAERANSRYLPGIRFPDALTVVGGDVMAMWRMPI